MPIQVDGSGSNNSINLGMCRRSYMLLPSIIRRHLIILGSTVFMRTTSVIRIICDTTNVKLFCSIDLDKI